MSSPSASSIHGVVLAAGRSERMGRPKALLVRNGRTLVSLATATLRAGGCADVTIVVSAAFPEVRAAAGSCGRVVVAPDDPGAEPIDSIRLAAAATPDARGLLILPVDCPFVGAATVAAVIARFAAGDTPAVVPVHGGEPGHPVLIGRSLVERLGEPLAEGLRTLLSGCDPASVEVADPAILADLDTPAEARSWGAA